MFSVFAAICTLFVMVRGNTNDTQCPNIGTNMMPSIIPVGTPVRLMQYNVEWFFLKTYNGCPGSSCSWQNLEDATTHMEYVADVIKKYLFGDYVTGSFFIHQFTNSYKTLNLNIETTSDFFWWLNFNFKWLDIYVRRCFEFDVFGQNKTKNNDVS